jgi:hypothetical protein
MATPTARTNPFLPVRQEWLNHWREEILEPELPIVDPHHHLWDRPGWRYLLDEMVADLNSGHNVVATIFVQCWAMHRADGPQEMRPVGETEFVNGVAAMSASDIYGPTRVCAGIVGHADLRLGAAVQEVLEAHLRAGGGRFRGACLKATSRSTTGPTLTRLTGTRANASRVARVARRRPTSSDGRRRASTRSLCGTDDASRGVK